MSIPDYPPERPTLPELENSGKHQTLHPRIHPALKPLILLSERRHTVRVST